MHTLSASSAAMFAALLLVVDNTAVAAPVYKYKDASGRMIYSDQAPPGTKPTAVPKALIGTKANGWKPPGPASASEGTQSQSADASSGAPATDTAPTPPQGSAPQRSGSASSGQGGAGGGGGPASAGAGGSVAAAGGTGGSPAASGGPAAGAPDAKPGGAATLSAATVASGAPSAATNGAAASAPTAANPTTAVTATGGGGGGGATATAPIQVAALSSPTTTTATADSLRAASTLATTAATTATAYTAPATPTVYVITPGQAPKPFTSIDTALTTLKGGDTLSLPGGTYRTFIDLRLARLLATTVSAERPLTITGAATGVRTTVRGSDIVTGWRNLGNGLWSKNPWNFNSQQVFVDGQRFKQVGGVIYGNYPTDPANPYAKSMLTSGGIWPGRIAEGTNSLTDGSFFYDTRTKVLFVKYMAGDLNAHTVEASVRGYLVFGSGMRYVNMKDITFEHSNTSTVNRAGAVTINGTNMNFEGLVFRNVDSKGLVVSGSDTVIINNLFESCGQLGLQAQGSRFRVVNNTFKTNNYRGFNTFWEAGGAKFVGGTSLDHSEISANIAIRNNGDGLWFDWGASNNVIRNNVLAYNKGMGIHYEAGNAATIHDNYAYGNTYRGIYAPHSSNVVIAHNMVIANGMDGAVVVDEGRRDTSGVLDLKPKSNRIIGNVFAWNSRYTVTLPSRYDGNLSEANLFLDPDNKLIFTVGWPGTTNPMYRGLPLWRSAATADMQSWPRVTAMPAAMASAISAQNLIQDWSAIRAVAAGYAVPSTVYDRAQITSFGSGSTAAPGPRP